MRGYGIAVANSRAYGGGMYAAPDAELDDGLLDVVTLSETSKWRFLTGVLPKVFDGSHTSCPRSAFAARRRSGSRPTARSRSTRTATTSPTCRRRSACCPGALRVIVPGPAPSG